VGMTQRYNEIKLSYGYDFEIEEQTHVSGTIVRPESCTATQGWGWFMICVTKRRAGVDGKADRRAVSNQKNAGHWPCGKR